MIIKTFQFIIKKIFYFSNCLYSSELPQFNSFPRFARDFVHLIARKHMPALLQRIIYSFKY